MNGSHLGCKEDAMYNSDKAKSRPAAGEAVQKERDHAAWRHAVVQPVLTHDEASNNKEDVHTVHPSKRKGEETGRTRSGVEA